MIHLPLRPALPSALRAAVLALPALLAACQDKAAEAPRPDRPVLVREVRFAPQVAARSLVGTVRPRVESDVGFRVVGKVQRRLVQVGDVVRRGQTLATLDDADFLLQRASAEADLTASRSALRQAEAEAKRATDLKAGGWSTDADLERRRAAVDEARGRVVRAERSLDLARNALAYSAMVADADGVVTATMVEPGQVVKLGDPHLRLAHLDGREAAVAIPETLVARAREGEVEVSLWARPEKTYRARLRELSPSADTATRTYGARFTILDPDDEVRFGATATLTLKDPPGAAVARLPLAALFDRGAGPSVWVVDPATGAVEARRVEVAGLGAEEALVRGGVKAGERVVALGAQKLDAGLKVRIVEGLGS